MKTTSIRFNTQTGAVAKDSKDSSTANKANKAEVTAKLTDDGKVEIGTPLGKVKLKEGEIDLMDGASARVFTEKGERFVSLQAKASASGAVKEPVLFKLGVDGFAEVKSFAKGMSDVLTFVQDGLQAAVVHRGGAEDIKPVAGTIIAEQITGNAQLHTIGGVVIERQPEVSKEEWAAREKAVIRKVVANPVQEYAAMRTRLEEKGPMAPFPEFEPVVARLLNELKELGPKAEGNDALMRHRQIAMTKLVHAGLKFRVDVEDYPYQPPFTQPYPYKMTLDAIKSAIEVFDTFAMTDKSQTALPLYHTDRYQYYWDAMTLDPKTVVFPTFEPLGFEDLIRVRSAPIGFIGVATETVFVDRHRNSPLDFFVHDINHVRRMTGYSDVALRDRKVDTKEGALAVYGEWQKFIDDKLLPMISLKGKTGEDNMLAHMVRLIVFELLHESAVEPRIETMLKTMMRPSGAPDPFEHMLAPGAEQIELNAKNIEEWRNKIGNVHSGVNELGFPEGNITVRYFMDRAVVLLGNVYNKMAFGFYDEFDDPKNYVAKPEDRTPQNVARAAIVLFELLGMPKNDIPKYDDLVKQACSQMGSEELFEVYPMSRGVPERRC